jgi:hypothetical protein
MSDGPAASKESAQALEVIVEGYSTIENFVGVNEGHAYAVVDGMNLTKLLDLFLEEEGPLIGSSGRGFCVRCMRVVGRVGCWTWADDRRAGCGGIFWPSPARELTYRDWSGPFHEWLAPL